MARDAIEDEAPDGKVRMTFRYGAPPALELALDGQGHDVDSLDGGGIGLTGPSIHGLSRPV